MVPGRMRQMALEALGGALFQQRNIVNAGDIDSQLPHEPRIGFLH